MEELLKYQWIWSQVEAGKGGGSSDSSVVVSGLLDSPDPRGIGGQAPGNIDDWFEIDEDLSQSFVMSANFIGLCFESQCSSEGRSSLELWCDSLIAFVKTSNFF